MKRILTVQDISCLGKCSITIALPVISALGVECVILPTAVLSNHTLFKSFTVKDLADQIVPICEKWQDEGVEFDAIYTGYLGTIEQIDMMKDLFKKFGSGDDKLGGAIAVNCYGRQRKALSCVRYDICPQEHRALLMRRHDRSEYYGSVHHDRHRIPGAVRRGIY